MSPERVKAMKDRGELTPARKAEYDAALERVREINHRYAGAIRQGETELHRISAWVLAQWPKDYSF